MLAPELYPAEPPLYLDYLRGQSRMLVLAFTGVGNRIDASRSWMNPSGHAVARCSKAKRHLRPLMAHVFNGEMAEACAVVESAGGLRFADYWQQRRIARRERRDHAAQV